MGGTKTLIRAAGTAVAFVAGLMLAMGSLGGTANASGGPERPRDDLSRHRQQLEPVRDGASGGGR